MLIDLDLQVHLTYSLGIMAHELTRTIYQVLRGEAILKDVILDRSAVKLIPSAPDFSGAKDYLALRKEIINMGRKKCEQKAVKN